ncbi:MAG: bifunctional metallophosphatase/5'-nucleotidase [Saprospiraceae bacterium]
MFRRFSHIALVLTIFVWGGWACSRISHAGSRPFEVVFLHINDVYEIAPIHGRGGLARVAGLYQQLKSRNPNTLFILAGDFLSPSVLGALRYGDKRVKGRHMVEALNAAGVQYVVFGNHEFDYDEADLQARLDESEFVWLGANARQVTPEGPRPFAKIREGKPQPCPDHLALTLRDAGGRSLRLGMLGVLVNSGRKPYVTYTDWKEAADISLKALRPQTDVVVALTHLNKTDDRQFAVAFPEIPLIMGGHDHENMLERIGPVTLAKADANAPTAYIHTLRYDPRARRATVRSELVIIDEKIPEDPATAAVVTKWTNIERQALKESGINSDAEITTLTQPLDCREAFIRYQQAPVGDLLTEAMIAASRHGAQCAVINSGSVRIDDLMKGKITEYEVVRMLPFGGGVSDVEVRGAMLRRMLDTGLKNQGNGGYLQYGKRIAHRGDNWLVNGAPIDEQGIYRVVLPNYMLDVGDQNLAFVKARNTDAPLTDNPEIPRRYKPHTDDASDVRRDVRVLLIDYWKKNSR